MPSAGRGLCSHGPHAAMGPDKFSANPSNSPQHESNRGIRTALYRIVLATWKAERVPQTRKYVVIVQVMYKKMDSTKRSKYRRVVLVAPVGKVLLLIIVLRHLGSYIKKDMSLINTGQSAVRVLLGKSTLDMMFNVRWLDKLVWRPQLHCICDSWTPKRLTTITANIMLLWGVLARCGVPPQVISTTRQFHDLICASVRLAGGITSEWLEGGQGLQQGYVLAPLISNVPFTAAFTSVQKSRRFMPDLIPTQISGIRS